MTPYPHPLAALAASLTPLYHAASSAALHAQWPNEEYHHRRGACAVRGSRVVAVVDPYWPLHGAPHYAWRGVDPIYGPGNGHLYVTPADRSEPRGTDAFAIPGEEVTA